jgi:hypothetical protein
MKNRYPTLPRVRLDISAYQSLATILEPDVDGKSTGWAILARSLGILGRYGSDKRVRAVLDLDTFLSEWLSNLT